jgi:hypothetical protein
MPHLTLVVAKSKEKGHTRKQSSISEQIDYFKIKIKEPRKEEVSLEPQK